MNSNGNHSQQGETKQSTSGTPASPQMSVAKVSSRFPTTRLAFNTAPAVIPSQQSERSITNSIGLRSASVQLEWRWLRVIDEDAATSNTTIKFVRPSNKDHIITVDRTKVPSIFVQSELIPKDLRDQTVCSNVRGNLENHWLMIYAFVDFSYSDRLQLRCMCRLFHKVEKILTANKHRYVTLMPMPKYTYFPHPNYVSLNELMDELNEMHAALPYIVWEECTAPEMLIVGMKVRVKYDIDATWFKDSTIEKVNDDETFDVVFVDADAKTNVPFNEIQIKNVSVKLSS
jgi:hypothetical protein